MTEIEKLNKLVKEMFECTQKNNDKSNSNVEKEKQLSDNKTEKDKYLDNLYYRIKRYDKLFDVEKEKIYSQLISISERIMLNNISLHYYNKIIDILKLYRVFEPVKAHIIYHKRYFTIQKRIIENNNSYILKEREKINSYFY